MISIELNTAIKQHLVDLGNPYNDIMIHPLSGYEATESPFIIYSEFFGTVNEEKFYQKVSNVVYTIYDNDISRMKDIEFEIDKFLNVGDRVEPVKAKLTSPYTSGALRYRMTTIRRVGGGTNPPPEREGRASLAMNFRVIYLLDGGSIA